MKVAENKDIKTLNEEELENVNGGGLIRTVTPDGDFTSDKPGIDVR